MTTPHAEPLRAAQAFNRRHFLRRSGAGVGSAALASLASEALSSTSQAAIPGAARAKRVIYLFQSGAPSQFESFDYKPKLDEMAGEELPASIRMGQRLTTMTSGQAEFPLARSVFGFQQHGDSGAWVSELLPYTAGVADDLCFIKTMKTDAINHDPAITFCQTGFQLAGRPSMGAWVSYGLGSSNRDLPSFIVLTSRGTGRLATQPLYARLWGTGFLPGKYQGVKLRSGDDPVLYLANPAGCSTQLRRTMLDRLADLNAMRHEQVGDPEIMTRVSQYEMAFRMQASVPDLTDISDEPQHVLDLYGPDVHKPGTYARNCLLARRLAERDVRFVQLYHMGWDQHDNLPDHMSKQCRDTDQPSAALITDLKQRGLLDDTVVIWGGEFGRTAYCQGTLTEENYGRDHHPKCFSIWVAGGGFRPGVSYGETDDFSYNIATPDKTVEFFDLNATVLHLLGLDHTKLTHRFQGRDYRLTDVHGRVLKELLA